MSEFRVEKRREAAELTLVTGATLSGVFFLGGASHLHTGPERVGDVMNLESDSSRSGPAPKPCSSIARTC